MFIEAEIVYNKPIVARTKNYIERVGRRSKRKEAIEMYTYEDISLRIIEEADIESIRKIRNDPTTWMYLSDSALLDAITQKYWYRSLTEKKDRKYYVLFDDAHYFLGIIRMDEIDPVNRSVRVGCDIVPSLRNKGYGTKAMRLIKKYCFDYLNMHRVWLAVLETNHIAQRLYQNHNFIEEGRYREAIFRDGKYHDYIIMSVLEEEYRKE